jgi:DNA-binding transcriptional LysR family regulator
VPTDAGEVLHQRARAILRQIDRDLEEVTRIGHGEEGRLDVGIVSSAIHLGPIENVQTFRACYPLVEVRLHEGFTSDIMRRVADGDIDAATVRDPDDEPGIRVTALLTEPFVAVLPIGHPLAARGPLDGAALADEPLVFFPSQAGRRAYELNLQPVTNSGRQPRIVQEASTWATIIRLVGAGLGVTIAPLSATIATPGTVVVVPLRSSGVRSTVALASREDDSRTLVKNFLALSSRRLISGLDNQMEG